MANPTPNPSYTVLTREIQAGTLAPVYLLYGEEGYFVDCLVKMFEDLVAPEDRDFNLYNMYGQESTAPMVIETCHRYPMMADRQVVILREAGAMNGNEINKLAPYIEHPTASTVLVIAMRGQKEVKGKELLAAIKKHGVVYESKKLNDRDIVTYISRMIADNRLNIEPKGLAMLRDFVGNDLSRIHNEVNKLCVALPAGATITPEVVEKHVGISKDYNNFELVDALAEKNVAKAFTIVSYFAANPKDNPTVVTVTQVFNFFSNLMIFLFNPDKTPEGQKKALGLKSDWQLKKYVAAARNYNARSVIEVIGAIRRMDTRSKGIGSRAGQYDLLRDMVFNILAARGNLAEYE
ncbi:MAG: DNA polymerase III subunit delta [Muribaculaceae bacterium]|nr:DNA polymerase III subunit delta [Muribaculaceae bacterium]